MKSTIFIEFEVEVTSDAEAIQAFKTFIGMAPDILKAKDGFVFERTSIGFTPPELDQKLQEISDDNRETTT